MQSTKRLPHQKLPIYKYKDQIIQLISKESAIVISGLTGCGKSTQVPQYLLDAYPQANIAVCEPRRLAATSLALRVCEQRKSKLSSEVGYQIGLESKRSDKTRLVYMTYGILIQELLFKQKLEYDFIILDEVHERSLEMDFAFVILKKIINQRIRQQLKQARQQKPAKETKIDETKASKQVTQSTHDGSKQSQTAQKPEQVKIIKPTNRNLKLIIMSATLNSEQFQKYFAVHKETGLIIEPEIVIRNPNLEQQSRRGNRQNQRRRGNADRSTVISSKKQVSVSYLNLEKYREGICIFIDEKSPFTVKEQYLDDFLPYFQEKLPSRNYEDRQEVRLDERHLEWGYKLIEKAQRDIEYAKKNTEEGQQPIDQTGDILVFLPGLVEINKMKELLIRNNKLFAQKIVQVHSLFSEELYYKLFKSNVRNKIILATNIGQSSITLPNCKVVIDYCLNRKAVKNDKEGISRFSTRVASLSNLIQRKGRVGRVSDGIVYRMIAKSQFQKLQEFDVPEIKCVSLDMAILKTKKLESTSKSHIFEDIYNIFLNVLEPPQIDAVQTAIDNLIHEDALEYVSQSQNDKENEETNQKINSGKKYDAKKLKITKVGQFMVSMPCDLGISKLILMGIKLGISSIIIDIAAIILSTKTFFCHEERRLNIEEYMHSMIGYDKGDNNDYLLRQRLFDHWRSRFFIPFRQKHRKTEPKSESKKMNAQTSFRIFDINDQVVQFDENYKIVDNFVKRQEGEEEKDFCKNRGVYGNHMRQLLRVSETLKIRIEMIGIEKEKLNGFQAEAQLVLICLMYAFPDVICEVTFDVKKRQVSNYFEEGGSNKVYVPLIEGLTKTQLERYLDPQRDYSVKEFKDSLIISSYDHVLKKFYLPKYYTKALTEKCSLLYKHCRAIKLKYAYEYNVHHGFSAITILNDSINKEILIPPEMVSQNKIQNIYLISNNLIESKGKYMMGASALVSHFQLVIISMIVKKNIKLFLHPSGEFFSHISLNDKKFEIPLLLTEEQLYLINNLRELSKRKKEEDISSYKEQFNKEQLKTLSDLFKFKNLKNAEEDWEEIFIEQEHRARSQHQNKPLPNYLQFYDDKSQNWIPIEKANGKMKKFKGKNYYERYNDWKKFLFQSTERQLKVFTTTQPILICGYCHKSKGLVEVASAHSYEFHSQLLKLNRYSGSWECPDSKTQDISEAGLKIYCTNKHHIGNTVDSDYAEIDHSNLFLYIPYNEVYLLQKIDSLENYNQILNKAKYDGMKALRKQHESFDEYDCKICYTKESQRKLFTRQQIKETKREKRQSGIKDPLWNAVINHTVSNFHINAREKLKKSIIWN